MRHTFAGTGLNFPEHQIQIILRNAVGDNVVLGSVSAGNLLDPRPSVARKRLQLNLTAPFSACIVSGITCFSDDFCGRVDALQSRI